jgi:hypothetical protein
MPRKPNNLTVVSPQPAATGRQPPGELGPSGRSLWDEITSSYYFDDRGSLETLYQAAAACDRAERCRREIERDGELIQTRSGLLKEHPLMKMELACRAFIVRALARLGLDLEPVRSGPGRPAGR